MTDPEHADCHSPFSYFSKFGGFYAKGGEKVLLWVEKTLILLEIELLFVVVFCSCWHTMLIR